MKRNQSKPADYAGFTAGLDRLGIMHGPGKRQWIIPPGEAFRMEAQSKRGQSLVRMRNLRIENCAEYEGTPDCIIISNT